ncbi:MAG TPA: FixH family protein [Bacilli bacterium]|nr:FixH family protein [Bacilli bacterium]
MKKVRAATVAVLFGGALLLNGCSAEPQNPLTCGINATFDLTPKQPVVGQETFFGLTLTEKKQDIEIPGAQVTLTLQPQGDTTATPLTLDLQEVETGRYTGTTSFPKPGTWNGHVTAEKDGTTAETDVEFVAEP